MEYDYDDQKIAPLTAEMCQYYDVPSYLIKGILAYGEIACIFGAPGAGKSLLALYIAYMVSMGNPISGIKTSGSSVLYLAFEDYDGIVRRVAGLYNRFGPAGGFFVDRGVGNLYEEDEEGNSFAIRNVAKYVRDNKISLVIIDTLSAAFYGLEENDNRSMNRVVERVKYLASATGAAVILVHHDTKSDRGTPRGHGVLNAALDMALHVRQTLHGNIEAKFTKIKNGSTETSLSFQVHIESIGVDFDGDAITTAVCEESDIDSEARECSKVERTVLQILDELRQSGPVSERKLQEACAAGNRVSGAGQPADRVRVARRHIQNLKVRGLIATVDGFVSRVGK